MPTPGRNDGFRILDDFACDAIPIPDATSATAGPKGRGRNPGMRVVADVALSSPVSAERVAELRALSNEQLLDIIRTAGAGLSSQELLAIHDIAAERMDRDGGRAFDRAAELSREAMLVAVNKCA